MKRNNNIITMVDPVFALRVIEQLVTSLFGPIEHILEQFIPNITFLQFFDSHMEHGFDWSKSSPIRTEVTFGTNSWTLVRWRYAAYQAFKAAVGLEPDATLDQNDKKYSPNVGLEPTTVGLRVQRSTDWASRAWLHRSIYSVETNRYHLYYKACWKTIELNSM